MSIIAFPVYSQNMIWGKMLGSEKEEYVLNHVLDNAGNIYVSGKTTGNIGGNNPGENDGFIVKLDSSGNTIWSRQFGSAGDEDIQWSAIDKSGNVYIVGSTTGVMVDKNYGKEDIIVIKYNPEGELKWKRQIGSDSSDVAKGICIDSKGNIYVTGLTGGRLGQMSFGKNDCFLLMLDKNGNLLKSHQFGTPVDDVCYSVVPGTNDDIFICGTTWGDFGGKNQGFIDGFTGHFNSSLEKAEFHQFGTDGFDIPLVIHADKNNDIFVAGSTSGNLESGQIGEGDCFILRMNEKGEIIWTKQFGTDKHDGVRGIDINDVVSDNVFISGIMNLPPEKAFIRIYNKDGKMLWEKTFEAEGFSGGTSGKDIRIDDEGNLTHIGLTGAPLFGPIIGGHDIYIVKMNIQIDHIKL